MAGDWIPMRTDLWECPEVVRLLSAICPDSVRDPSKAVREKSRIIGALFRTWSLFDTYTDDGILHGYTAEVLNAAVGLDNWAENLQHIGWLDINEQSVVMPEFNVWLSSSAKARLKDAQRKRNERKEASEDCPKPVRKSADKNRTTGQDRTGEYSDTDTDTETPKAKPKQPTHWAEDHSDLADDAKHSVEPLPPGSKFDTASVFKGMTAETIQSPTSIVSWFRRQLSAKSPVLDGTRADLLLALCASLKASEPGPDKPVGVFVDLVTKKRWNAVKRLRERAEEIIKKELRCDSACCS